MSKIPWDQVFSFTLFDGVKLGVTAVVILMVTKIQLFHDKLSALLIALPLTSLIAMIWMHQGKQGSERIANHAESTFWFVLPTLPMFLIFPCNFCCTVSPSGGSRLLAWWTPTRRREPCSG